MSIGKSVFGKWDNFLQIWQEQTEDEIHRVEVTPLHGHYHIEISPAEDRVDQVLIKVSEGRNGSNYLGTEMLQIDQLSIEDDALVIKKCTLFTENDLPYRFLQCRYFSGWIQYPDPQGKEPDFFQRDLVMHDQGAMVGLEVEGVDYTIELTQLVFAHTLPIMKLAIYDLPLEEVGINSKAISYTWTSPESKRLGINLRKILSGWTFIEENFISSNNTQFEKK